ncbi:MAG: class I SAM-dependent methyltransferase [Bacteroidia bacterium]
MTEKMDENTLRMLAGQLRQPQGEFGVEVSNEMNKSNFHQNHFTIDALEVSAGDNILEIGMGNGLFVKDIFAFSDEIHYTGCDFSGKMVEEASRHNAKLINEEKAEFHVASVFNLPFAEAQFNKVFAVNCIYFWDDVSLALSQIWKVLKPGGRLYISVRPKSLMENFPFVKWGFELYAEPELVQLLSQNKLEVVSAAELEEPPVQLQGEDVILRTLIVCAQK